MESLSCALVTPALCSLKVLRVEYSVLKLYVLSIKGWLTSVKIKTENIFIFNDG